jgi:phage anti-repressor protein
MQKESKAGTLLPLIVEPDREPMVDARKLHQRLKSKQQFADWIKSRTSNPFVEGEDFFINLRKSTGGRPEMDYSLTMDTAKHICMMERNEVGYKFRKYFIEAEKELREKRMYGQVATMTDIRRSCQYLTSPSGVVIYHLRNVQAMLGFSTKSSYSSIRRRYGNQLCIVNRVGYVTEAYVRLMIRRASARNEANLTLEAAPVPMFLFSHQLKLAL